MQHNCGTTRSIGYFLEPMLSLLPFAKLATTIEFIGVTNDKHTRSVDLLRTVALPSLSKSFGIPVDGMQLKIKKRGAPPEGGGLVEFTCPIVPKISSLTLLDPGLVRRVRGIAYCTRVSPQVSNRLRESARSILNDFVKDIFIYTDYYKGDEAGKSPGYALSLVAETTTGCLIGAEAVGEEGSVPEDVGALAVKRLLEEVSGRGCVDMPSQSLFLLYMALTPADVSQLKLGPLTPYSIQTLRLLKDSFGVEFQFEEEEREGGRGGGVGVGGGVVAQCVGTAYVNISRKIK